MPYKDPEKAKEHDRQYYLKNKEKKAQKSKEYRFKNKEKLKEYRKEYYKTPQGLKSSRISQWKQQGILCFDYNLLYDIFLSTSKCEYCDCELYGRGNNKKCLDHDHSITDKFNIRGVVCNSCNIKDVLG